MWKTFYQKANFEFGIDIASSFSGMAFNAFWKRALNMSFLNRESNQETQEQKQKQKDSNVAGKL